MNGTASPQLPLQFRGRLCHFSVQYDHLHLRVEAANREALSQALHALAIRIARAINRVLGRKGCVFADLSLWAHCRLVAARGAA